MIKRLLAFLLSVSVMFTANAQTKTLPADKKPQTSLQAIDSILPVRGLAIAAPSAKRLDEFVRFIEQELAPGRINLLILRVDYNYAYESHPELRDSFPLSKADVKKIVAAGKKHGIKIAPQINLLGHQSWATKTTALLRVYPEFDETPHVDTKNYTGWPNADGLYCKSYCPLHPGVHKVVFALVDEIMDAFEAEWFHAGMDEVFYIGDDKCPRCSGRDKAELFANEVTKIREHLASKNRRLMIWGDRLIDGKTTGIGMWEASMNNTHRAIDMIPKDVFICDWHYERPDATAVYFAMKGFSVATCPWRKPELALQQVADMQRFRNQATKAMKPRFEGIIATVWSGADRFLDSYYNPALEKETISDALTLKRLMQEFKKL
ncbi:family 20 glycosylhydrolase [Flavihumibacter sediminis]|nr:family 20 glycosylhydrolase [Flavihumibacter sediminis]